MHLLGTSKHTIQKRGFFAILGGIAAVAGITAGVVATVCLFTGCQSNSSDGGDTSGLNPN